MNVVVTTEYRFSLDEQGKVCSSSGTRGYRFWKRYLAAFDEVIVVGRLARSVVTSGSQVEGNAVRVRPLPNYIGPFQYLIQRRELRDLAAAILRDAEALILRSPGAVAGLFAAMRAPSRPYAVEVVGDPWDVFAPGAVRHPLRPFARRWFARQLRQQCANACAAAYVTDHALQRLYPCPGFAIGVSDVELDGEAFVANPIAQFPKGEAWHFVMVGSLDQMYKAPDVVLKAMALLLRSTTRFTLTIVGDGRYRSQLEQQSRDLGVSDHVCFAGRLPAGAAIRERLDVADLFLMPSRTEGLPRAMLEAMARALPCVGSTVGGIPELLPSDCMVPPGNAELLANRIGALMQDADRLRRMSARNLEKAHLYIPQLLDAKRLRFYRELVSRSYLEKPKSTCACTG